MTNKNSIIICMVLSCLSPICHFSAFLICLHLITLPSDSQTTLLASITFLLLLILSSMMLSYLTETKSQEILFQKIMGHFPNIFQQILMLPIHIVKKHPPFELAKLLSDYEQSIHVIAITLINIFPHAIIMTLILGYVCFSYPYYGFASFFILSLVTLFQLITNLQHKKHLKKYSQSTILATDFLDQALSQIEKIKSSHLESTFYSRWLNYFNICKQDTNDTEKTKTFMWLTEQLLFPLLLLSSLMMQNPLPLLLVSYQITQLYQRLSTELTSLSPHLLVFHCLREIIKHPTIISPHLYHTSHGDIRLAGVCCRQLKNINLHISSGSFTAITGASGIGKSTLFKLMLGLEHRYTGTILFDGLNIRDLNADFLRQRFGVVLQTTVLFPGTIFSNIALNRSVTLDDAWELANQVNLADDIKAMPMKMFTYVSDQAGYAFSTGQRQKILLARALANKPRVLFLDEATAALDETCEASVFNQLKSRSITIVAIAHRASTLAHAHNVYNLSISGCDIIKQSDRSNMRQR